ncbi:hypothetical protein DNH61_11805 [Paenibacillus sambharensis]|uniref:Uncharacterized protein n=1 Tax=Paenibacillus sambharensis TaxID=1803190 RepID=A0A2W1L559_9BACL|nr:hypothetical protein DNH61_11805 [Paenibacillus sambharensis]
MQRPPKTGDTLYCPLCDKDYYRLKKITSMLIRDTLEPIGDAELPEPEKMIECPVHHLPFKIRGGE